MTSCFRITDVTDVDVSRCFQDSDGLCHHLCKVHSAYKTEKKWEWQLSPTDWITLRLWLGVSADVRNTLTAHIAAHHNSACPKAAGDSQKAALLKKTSPKT